MANLIELCNVIKRGSTFTFNIINSPILTETFEASNGIKIKSSLCPEVCGKWFFVWGEDTSENLLECSASISEMKAILIALKEFSPESYVVNSGLFLFTCEQCGAEKPADHYTKHATICEECYLNLKFCAECGRIHAEYVFGDKYYCKYCISKQSCGYCNKPNIITRQRGFNAPSDYHGAMKWVNLCADCFPLDIKIGTEHHYHYVPEKLNFWDINTKTGRREKKESAIPFKLYMGTEVEAQFPPEVDVNVHLYKIQETYGLKHESILYAKHDGTIPNPGSEIVTHPMTLAMYHDLTWKGLFDHVIKPEVNTIGGHIHLSKTAFRSIGHTYKFIRFIRTNIDYITYIGERLLQGEWSKARSNNGKAVSIAKKYKSNVNNDRYEMINFTIHTIELRFFKAPHTSYQLYKNVEFCDALYNYTINSPLHFSVKDFEAYVDKKAKDYPYLYDFMLNKTKPVEDYVVNEEYTHNSYPRYVSEYLDECEEDDDCEEEYNICAECGNRHDTESSFYINGSVYCEECTSYCDCCDSNYIGEASRVCDYRGNDMLVCGSCADSSFRECACCSELVDSDYVYETDDNLTVCQRCLELGNSGYRMCDSCDNILPEASRCSCGCEDEVSPDDEELGGC